MWCGVLGWLRTAQHSVSKILILRNVAMVTLFSFNFFDSTSSKSIYHVFDAVFDLTRLLHCSKYILEYMQ